MTWPEDPGWRVRVGGGLLAYAPLSDEQREIQRREDEREAQQVAFEREQREQEAAERRGMAQLRGEGARHTVGEFLAGVAYADAREQRKIAERKRLGLPVDDDGDYFRDPNGKPQQDSPAPHRLNRWELQKAQREREAEKATTNAKLSDLDGLQQQVTKVKSALHAATGWKPI